MSHEQQPQKPITYGDVFPSVQGELAEQPITAEDAALMQSAETIGLGQSQKGGAAAVMQSAATKNVNAGLIPKDAHTPVADAGVTVVETVLPGEVVHTEYIGGQPVTASSEPTPMAPAVAAIANAVTIGEALEAAAVASDEPIEQSDARAIQSAEKRATGMPITCHGGVSSIAQSAADVNARVDDESKKTLADVLTDASLKLVADKAVTREDAEKVAEAEKRSRPSGDIRASGVAAAMKAAADYNQEMGITAAASSGMQKLELESNTNVAGDNQ